MISGSLPAGLTLNGATGAISGTPTTSGLSSFTVQVQDVYGGVETRGLTIQIYSGLSVTTSSLSDGTVSAAYSQTLRPQVVILHIHGELHPAPFIRS